MDILEKLFGNAAKLRIVKLFIFNPEVVFDEPTICSKTKVSRGIVHREVANLLHMGLIKEKSFFKEAKVQRNRKMVFEKKRVSGFMLNYRFDSLEQLYSLFSGQYVFKKEDLISKISKGVKIDLLIISGFFLQESDSRVDMLVVGEQVKENILEQEVKNIEADIGREITYAVFTTTEFKYRMSVFDKLIRDILDYKHEKLINKLNL